MADHLRDWLAVLDSSYPTADAADWDSVGLQVGSPDDAVSAILVCLDVTRATLAEAQQRHAEVLLAHHPLFFRPLERLTPSTAPGALALDAARRGVSVVAAHTNFDVATHGTTGPIMAALEIRDAAPMVAIQPATAVVKLAVFTPAESTGAVLDAAFAAGAGTIGEYTECSFRVSGTGTFRPSAQTAPAVGERERRNDVPEERLEVVVPRAVLGEVVRAVVAAHPYEEVAFDVFPTVAVPPAGTAGKGTGRIGELPAPRRLADVAAALRERLPSPHLRFAGDPQRLVRRIAACGGAGDGYISAALAAGADCYITGDLRHHVTLDALTQGLAVIDAGHYATEAPALTALLTTLEKAGRERGLTARLLASTITTEPWAAGDSGKQEDAPR
jgi:dinuclear metal center YbgI/SA1388 family protein